MPSAAVDRLDANVTQHPIVEILQAIDAALAAKSRDEQRVRDPPETIFAMQVADSVRNQKM
jgi:hypothetical protein